MFITPALLLLVLSPEVRGGRLIHEKHLAKPQSSGYAEDIRLKDLPKPQSDGYARDIQFKDIPKPQSDGYAKEIQPKDLPNSKTDGYAFYATLTSDTPLTPGSEIKFDSVVTNLGDRYFASSGQFICPDDATYAFFWNIVKASVPEMEGMRCITNLRSNGTNAKHGPKTDYRGIGSTGPAEMSMVVRCAANAAAVTVTTAAWSDSIPASVFRGASYTTFSGFKLGYGIGFSVGLSQDLSLLPGGRLRFDVIHVDFGSSFDIINRRFVCPDDGVYLFSVSVHAPNSTEAPRSVSQLVMEGHTIMQGPITFKATPAYDSGSSSINAVVQCRQDFSVYVEAQQSADFFYNLYGADLTSFSGFKLLDVDNQTVAFSAVMTQNHTSGHAIQS